MRENVNYFCLLFFILLFTKGQKGFFIKHSSGLCMQPVPPWHNLTWHKVYTVHFQNTCLHPDAQFRYFEIFSGLVHNIEKNGTLMATPYAGLYHKFQIYSYSNARKTRTFLIYQPQFELKQTSAGGLRLNNGYCATPVIHGSNPKQPLIPTPGSAVYETKTSCDQEEQKFVFGSVTCAGKVTTDVNCHQDQVMVIQNAVYGGRSDMKTCGYNANTDCSKSVICLAKLMCNGKQNCAGISVEDNLFQINPCGESPNYLHFEYICADKPKPVQRLPVTDVRLSSSLLPNEGFLDVNICNTRRNVCNTALDSKGKAVVCRQLGYKGVKQHNPPVTSPVTYYDLFKNISRSISCNGGETALSQCVVNNAANDCTSIAYVACSICSEPLLEDRANFADSIFSASGFTANHTPAKARLSSNSSWCAPSNVVNYLDIELEIIYVINSVTIFGDAVSANWVTSYKLNYTHDKINWMEYQINNNKLISGNNDGYSSAATITLGDLKAKVLRIIPITSNGELCMRIQICGHTLFPDQLQVLNINSKTSTTVSFSWNPPLNDGDKTLSVFRVQILKKNSVVRNFTVTSTSKESTIKDLSPYTEYDVSVAAGNVHGFGKERRIKFTTDEAAPSGSPRDIIVIAESPSSLKISWKEPEKDKQNGIITSYTVCISYVKDGLCFQKFTIVEMTLLISNLDDSTKYFVRVLASTKAGSGNFGESKKRFTNAQPLEGSINKTSNTLSFMLEIPSGNYSYFQVIALKVLDGKLPSMPPDSFTESELVTYDALKSFPQPKPYVAAVFSMSKQPKKVFVLGDGENYSLSKTKRRRRSTPGVYFNGPLDPETSYSVFQRVYKDQTNYYSSGWSPLSQTATKPSTTKEARGECSQTAFYIVIAILVIIIAVLIVVVVYLSICRPSSQTPTTTTTTTTTKDKVVTSVDNKSFNDGTYEVPSSMDQNREDNNEDSSQYEDLKNRGKDQDEHVYQSLQK